MTPNTKFKFMQRVKIVGPGFFAGGVGTIRDFEPLTNSLYEDSAIAYLVEVDRAGTTLKRFYETELQALDPTGSSSSSSTVWRPTGRSGAAAETSRKESEKTDDPQDDMGFLDDSSSYPLGFPFCLTEKKEERTWHDPDKYLRLWQAELARREKQMEEEGAPVRENTSFVPYRFWPSNLGC